MQSDTAALLWKNEHFSVFIETVRKYFICYLNMFTTEVIVGGGVVLECIILVYI